jgi:hypothetical protein
MSKQTERECAFDGCDRNAWARSLCTGHYSQHRAGQPLRPLRVRGVCAMDGCNEPHASLGWCNLHYNRFRRGWDMSTDTSPVESDRKCEFPGCDRPYRVRGLCNTHNQQRRRGVPLTPIRVGGQRWRTGLTGYGEAAA